MKLKWSSWLYSLGQAVIGGVAASGTTWLGTLIGNQIDKALPILQWKQMGIVLLTSMAFNLFFFLKQSPLPKAEPELGDTDFIEKDK